MLVQEEAKAGCLGCAYEDAKKCPADNGQLEFDFGPCTDGDKSIIFKENKDE